MRVKKTSADLFKEAKELEDANCYHEASVVEDQAKALLKKEQAVAKKQVAAK